jgi:hypothetical protein
MSLREWQVRRHPVHTSRVIVGEVLAASVWPRGVTADVRDATVQRVRQWLGTDSQGGHQLRSDATGRLYLGPEVAIDWHRFCELVHRSKNAQTRDERELLRRAMHLVRGPFMSGTLPGAYSWIARVHLERVVPDLVVQTSHRLAELTLATTIPPGRREQRAPVFGWRWARSHSGVSCWWPSTATAVRPPPNVSSSSSAKQPRMKVCCSAQRLSR